MQLILLTKSQMVSFQMMIHLWSIRLNRQMTKAKAKAYWNQHRVYGKIDFGGVNSQKTEMPVSWMLLWIYLITNLFRFHQTVVKSVVKSDKKPVLHFRPAY